MGARTSATTNNSRDTMHEICNTMFIGRIHLAIAKALIALLIALVECAAMPNVAASPHRHGVWTIRLRGGESEGSPLWQCTVECEAWGQDSRRKWKGTTLNPKP